MANLVRYTPWRSLAPRERQFSPFSTDFWFEPFSIFPWERSEWLDPWGLAEFFPGDNLAIDLYEEDDRLVVKASLPGVREKDIEVIEQDGILTIRAKSEEQMEQKQAGWQIRAERYGAWQRSLRLPMEVNFQRAEATLKDGILTISLPKREPHKNLIQRIQVKAPKFRLPGLFKKEGNIKISHH